METARAASPRRQSAGVRTIGTLQKWRSGVLTLSVEARAARRGSECHIRTHSESGSLAPDWSVRFRVPADCRYRHDGPDQDLRRDDPRRRRVRRRVRGGRGRAELLPKSPRFIDADRAAVIVRELPVIRFGGRGVRRAEPTQEFAPSRDALRLARGPDLRRAARRSTRSRSPHPGVPRGDRPTLSPHIRRFVEADRRSSAAHWPRCWSMRSSRARWAAPGTVPRGTCSPGSTPGCRSSSPAG